MKVGKVDWGLWGVMNTDYENNIYMWPKKIHEDDGRILRQVWRKAKAK